MRHRLQWNTHSQNSGAGLSYPPPARLWRIAGDANLTSGQPDPDAGPGRFDGRIFGVSIKPPRSRVLIVEDEWLIAEYLVNALSGAGFEVMGPTARVAQALALIEQQPPDAAMLDVSLKGERSYPIAIELKRRRIPFAFMTGYSDMDLPGELRTGPILTKPARQSELLECLRGLLAAPIASGR